MKKVFLLLSLILIFFYANAQAPLNDEPCGAIVLPILESADACVPTALNITNATFSNLVIPFTCGAAEDVWFKFTPATGVSKIFLHKESVANQYFIETFTAGACNGGFTTVNTCIYINADGDYELPVVPAQVNYLRIFKYDGVTSYPNFSVNICLFSGLPTSASKVGINTKFPNANLDIAGNVRVRDSINIKNVNISGNFKLSNGSVGANKILTSDANGLASWQVPALQANYWSLGGSNIYNNNVGNIGIGINNPQYKFHIGNNNAGLRIEGPAATLSGGTALSIGGTGDVVVDKAGTIGGRFTIKENGNVGIGVSSPTSKLDINGSLKITDGNQAVGKILTSDVNGNASWQPPVVQPNYWSLNTYSDIYNTNLNNIGIGAPFPSSKLEVNGKITIDQKNIGGYGGLFIQGNSPGYNHPNIAFGIYNNFAFNVVGAMVQGELINNTIHNESVELGFYTTNSGIGSLSQKFLIKGNGNAILTGSFHQNSDVRLKINIKRINNPLNKLTQLNGYTYNWISKDKDPNQQIGLIAQEVQKLYPQLVSEIKGQNGETTLAVNYIGLIPVMIESIKEQQKQIDELKMLLKKLLNN